MRSNRLAGWLAVGGLALAWLLLFGQLYVDWTVNPQYGYGWFVPVLGGLLFWRRWTCRPDPRATEPMWLFLVPGFLCLAALLPLSAIEEANPEWRLAFWVHGLLNVTLSAAVIGYAGGLPWLRHFAFPVLYLLITIPWPVIWEQKVIQGLMPFVAAVTVQILDFQGIPAIPHGHVIQVATGTVGVDEACSGVRSLQTSLFFALYLGEYYRLRWLRRVLLALGGLGIAILANIGRTWCLTYVAALHGPAELDSWHDPVGVVVLFLVLGGIWLLVARAPYPSVGRDGRAISSARSLPAAAGVAMLLWLGFVLLGTEFWFRAHERNVRPQAQWTLIFPENASDFRKIEIAERATAMLRQTEARSAAWTDAAGHLWQVYFLRWAPGRNSAQLAKGHRPEICLPGTGLQLVEEFEERPFSIGTRQLPFRQYVFQSGARTLHVFYCSWEDRVRPLTEAEAGNEDGSRDSRLEAAWRGRRHLGQRVLEVMIVGPASPEAAADALSKGLASLVRDESTAGRAGPEGRVDTAGEKNGQM